MTSLRFYGLGNDSSVDDRSTYLLNDQSAMGYFWLNPRGLLSLGAQGGWLSARTDSGDVESSIEDVFEPDEVPGFMDPRTDFLVTGGWVEFDLRDKWSDPGVGVVARITTKRYEDTGLSVHDFTRVIADVKGYVPLGPKSRVLALRFYTSHSVADSGKEVPFYLMETLGGATSVRGFREWRFRDTRNLYVAAEYRWEVMPFVDFTFFLDAGKVFADKSDFSFDSMHTGYGFGIRTHAPGGMPFEWISRTALKVSNFTSAPDQRFRAMHRRISLSLLVLVSLSSSLEAQKFYPDDPLLADNDKLDVPEKPEEIELSDMFDRFGHMFHDFGASAIGSEATNVNTPRRSAE